MSKRKNSVFIGDVRGFIYITDLHYTLFSKCKLQIQSVNKGRGRAASSLQSYGFTVEIQIFLIPCNQRVRNVSINISEEKSIFTHHIQIYTENGIKLTSGEKKRKEQRAKIKETS